jgi:hypothetical protein
MQVIDYIGFMRAILHSAWTPPARSWQPFPSVCTILAAIRENVACD